MQVLYFILAFFQKMWYTVFNIKRRRRTCMSLLYPVNSSDVDELIFGSDESVIYSQR